jgi:sulfite reductase subunit B
VKKSVTISKSNFRAFIKKLTQNMEVIGVKSKQGKFAYATISDVRELCMDYNVTINPPTKYFLPAKEILLKYKLGENGGAEPVKSTNPRVLVGVHPYDIRAIELIDSVYTTINPDPNYLARRNSTAIIGVDCLNPSPKSFAPSMGTNVTESGFDLMLTDIGNSYVATIGSKKGADLLRKYAEVREATLEELGKQKEARDKALTRFKQELLVPRERMPRILEENYDNPYWESRSKTCFSCGSCVMVCPTCFCFDVKDEVSLNLKDGDRYRQWDGCMLTDFAKIATGENFRPDRTSRFRHRIFRKGKYLLEKYGIVGCVGCGRCTTACLVDIASPVEAFNSIVESSRAKEEAARILKATKAKAELYLPDMAEVISIRTHGSREKVFTLRLVDGRELGHRPGQFVEVSIPGIGEAPISISSSPTRGPSFDLGVRNVGNVTNAIHQLKEGMQVGIRGPFGNGFPLAFLEGKDILFVAGGIGLFPLRSLMQYAEDRRNSFGKTIILFGSRSPQERMFVDELEVWKKNPSIEFHETVDRGDGYWKGNVGVITTLIPKVDIDIKKTVAVVVGPPVMYRYVIIELKKRGLADENIVMSLERRMRCGVGKCGHCQINGVYVCQEGPVFSLAQLRNMREAV